MIVSPPQVVNERDILGTQLIRRNDELALLYEKIRIMQSTLEKGEVQYNNRLKVRTTHTLRCNECSSYDLIARYLFRVRSAHVSGLSLWPRLISTHMLAYVVCFEIYVCCAFRLTCLSMCFVV